MRLVGPITPAQFLRQHVLRMSETALAKELKVHQTAITRYTKFPEHHRKAIDRLARKRRKINIKPEWHEKVPWQEGVPED